MFVLSVKYPVAINVGKIDYNLVYRWKQIAMCENIEPLQEYIKKQAHPDDFRIEEYPR